MILCPLIYRNFQHKTSQSIAGLLFCGTSHYIFCILPMEKLVCCTDFEHAAVAQLDRSARDFYCSGADEELTLGENRRAFHRWIVRPRVLRDVSTRSLTTTALGKPVPFPIGVSPTASHKLCHSDGEVATARAAASLGMIYVLSTLSTCSIEQVASATSDHDGARLWFQLYLFDGRSETVKLIRRAEAAGFEALVLTVDSVLIGKRRADLRNGFKLPEHLRFANFDHLGKDASTTLLYRKCLHFTWADLAWLRSVTKLPIILKGILTAEDARLAVEHGVAAVFVSNHGGRQLDTVAASIDVLEEVVHAVRGRCEVYMDGGVRTGTDVFKALALGARMVFAGRPFLWGLTVGGEAGVRRVGEILRDELELVMSLSGVANVSEIRRQAVARNSLI